MSSAIRFNCVGYIDRRSEDLHARYDEIERRRWERRVARNHKERDRLLKNTLRRKS